MIQSVRVLVCALGIAMAVEGNADAASRTVCASGCEFSNLQAAIDAAAYGDTILLRAGQTFVGHFILRAKPGSGVITIRSDAPNADLPAAGTRLVPSTRPGGNTPLSKLARLSGIGTGAYKSLSLLRTEPGAHGYVLAFLDFDGTAHVGNETLIQIGEASTAAPPYDITFDRVYVHGHRYKGQKRGLSLQAKQVRVLNSYISDIKSVGADSQAINSYNGAGPFTIENNFLEAAGENVLFGGGDPSIANLVPSDIVMRRNHLFKPLAWRQPILQTPASVRAAAGTGGALSSGRHYFRVVAVMTTGPSTAVSARSAEVSASVAASGKVTVSWTAVPGADRYRVYRGTSAGGQSRYLETTATSLAYGGRNEISGTPPSTGTKWVVKNTFELKNAQRVTFDGNVIENSWAAGQMGYAIVLTPRNSGAAPWTRVQHVTFTNNVIRAVAGVVNIAGYDNLAATQRTQYITFRNNLFEDVDPAVYGKGTRAMLVGDGAASMTFDRNTIIHTNSSVLYGYGADMPGLVYTNNISLHNAYGIMGAGSSTGMPTLSSLFPGAVVRCNVFAGGPASLYPTPNAFPTVAQWAASFVNAAQGDYRLVAGSVVSASGCSGVIPGADFARLKAALNGNAALDSNAALDGNHEVPPPPGTNLTPIASTGGPYQVATGALVSTDGTGSKDPDGSVLDYSWSWGDEILVRAADLPQGAIKGADWVRVTESDAAGGAALSNPDKGVAKRGTALAAPASYVEFTVNVAAGVPYRLWLRARAEDNAYGNDSVHLQFSGAVTATGVATARIGTTSSLPVILEETYEAGVSGWGWTDSAYGGAAPPIYFAQTGRQTIRIQQREDGIAWDQLILSSAVFQARPGAAKNDSTIVDEAFGTSAGVSATHRYARAGTYPVVLTVTDAGGATATSTTTVVVK